MNAGTLRDLYPLATQEDIIQLAMASYEPVKAIRNKLNLSTMGITKERAVDIDTVTADTTEAARQAVSPNLVLH